ncbi:hypothetical protein PR048_025427 [Dryococelus australis]|uniref:Uncharacterized protein n=1 Tax=Dryococelus australis TaxID=614101 RepID=A0ABQ9GR99_9NEOP|nr:hypothetical protein PR048_025427 [Dryococelus australis]
MPAIGGFSRGSRVYPALAFRRCSILTSFHPDRLARPLLFNSNKYAHNLVYPVRHAKYSTAIRSRTVNEYVCVRGAGKRYRFFCTVVYSVAAPYPRRRFLSLQWIAPQLRGARRNGVASDKPPPGLMSLSFAHGKHYLNWGLVPGARVVRLRRVSRRLHFPGMDSGTSGEFKSSARINTKCAFNLIRNMTLLCYPNYRILVIIGIFRKEPNTSYIGWLILRFAGTTAAEWLACSPPTKANRPGHQSCRTMPLVGGFSRDLPFPPPVHSGVPHNSSQSPSSALQTTMFRAAQISLLTLRFDSNSVHEPRIDYKCVYYFAPRKSRWGRSEANMDKRRNERAGKMEEPRGNPRTSDIVRRDSHTRRTGFEPSSPRRESSSLITNTAHPLPLRIVDVEVDLLPFERTWPLRELNCSIVNFSSTRFTVVEQEFTQLQRGIKNSGRSSGRLSGIQMSRLGSMQYKSNYQETFPVPFPFPTPPFSADFVEFNAHLNRPVKFRLSPLPLPNPPFSTLLSNPSAHLASHHGELGSVPPGASTGFSHVVNVTDVAVCWRYFYRGAPVFPATAPSSLRSNLYRHYTVFAESIIEASYRRQDCTPVQCFARRGDERVDAQGKREILKEKGGQDGRRPTSMTEHEQLRGQPPHALGPNSSKSFYY